MARCDDCLLDLTLTRRNLAGLRRGNRRKVVQILESHDFGLAKRSGLQTWGQAAANGCIYCYTLGYANTPQGDSIQVYANAASKLREELRRKRHPPRAVYFSPSSDLFQPVREVRDLALDILHVLFEHGIRVSFLTKGQIPVEHMNLLRAHASLVEAQVGLITLDEKIHGLFEP